jgi:hypothetical protein
MKTVRHNTFETNSSSSHSLTISGKVIRPSKLKDTNTYTIYGGEYGWGYETYSDPVSKISYTAVEALSTNNETLKDWLEEIIKEMYKVDDVVYEFSTDYNGPNHSYIDHQSYGTVADSVSSKDDLEHFLFGDNSVLTIDNDNH